MIREPNRKAQIPPQRGDFFKRPMTQPLRDTAVQDTRLFLDLMQSTHQWDGVPPDSVKRWLNNFTSADLTYFATRILRHLLYYSERDTALLLNEVIIHRLLGTRVRSTQQLASGYSKHLTTLQWNLNSAKARTLITPLLDANKPSESSLALTRLLMQELPLLPTSSRPAHRLRLTKRGESTRRPPVSLYDRGLQIQTRRRASGTVDRSTCGNASSSSSIRR